MTDPRLEAIARDVAELEETLGSGTPPTEAVKRRIAAALREVEGVAAEVSALKERIGALLERGTRGAAEAPPESRPSVPLPQIRADHLGASTFIEKGWSSIALGDHAAALAALERALELAPGDRQALALLGWAQMLDQRYDDALGTFSQVLAVEPANALARVNVGYICLKKRIFGEAIEHLSRAIRLDNDRKATLYANYYLGLVYLEREMYLDAQTFLAKAIGLGPNLIEAYYDLGRAQWWGGDPEGAKATWRKGASANRFAPWAKRCRELLEQVEQGGAVPRSSPG